MIIKKFLTFTVILLTLTIFIACDNGGGSGGGSDSTDNTTETTDTTDTNDTTDIDNTVVIKIDGETIDLTKPNILYQVEETAEWVEIKVITNNSNKEIRLNRHQIDANEYCKLTFDSDTLLVPANISVYYLDNDKEDNFEIKIYKKVVAKGHYQITDQASLEALSKYTIIKGSISFSKTTLTNIDSLSNIIKIDGYLSFYDNTKLIDIDGLQNLTEITEFVSMRYNHKLQDLNGLKNLERMGNYLEVYDNDDIKNLKDLKKLKTISGNITIQNNYYINSIEIDEFISQLINFTGNVTR